MKYENFLVIMGMNRLIKGKPLDLVLFLKMARNAQSCFINLILVMW